MPIEHTVKHESIRLWQGAAPGALGEGDDDIPDLAVYPAASPTGGAVVVCPGGGYGGHAPHEGEPLAIWLNSLGITGAVLKYRLGPKYRHPVMLGDVSRAIRTLRSSGKSWGIDPAKVGVLGFSAGGHLAATVSVHYDGGDPSNSDPIERAGSRPDVSILIYPVVSFDQPHTHVGSRENLLGPDPDPSLVTLLSCEQHVSPHTPPTFFALASDDTPVPPENSLYYALALGRAKVPYEMHLYESGGHGFGMGTGDESLSRWPDDCALWLKRHGF